MKRTLLVGIRYMSAASSLGALILGAGCGPVGGGLGAERPDAQPPPPVVLPDDLGAAPELTNQTACVQSTAKATAVKRPVDIVLVLPDTDLAFNNLGIARSINRDLYPIVEAAKIDYRLTVLSRYHKPLHGDTSGICVAQPLGTAQDADGDGLCDFDRPETPRVSERFLQIEAPPYDQESWCHLIKYLEPSLQQPWGALYGDDSGTPARLFEPPQKLTDSLKRDSFKLIIYFGDQQLDCRIANYVFTKRENVEDLRQRTSATDAKRYAEIFDEALRVLAPEYFKLSNGFRNYSYWSMVGVPPWMASSSAPGGLPYPPDETQAPLVEGGCSYTSPQGQVLTTPSSGLAHQALSLITGGLRYPVCSTDFKTIFERIAQSAVDGAELPCTFTLPTPPAGKELDTTTIEMTYSSAGTQKGKIRRTMSADACDDKSFFLVGGQLTLCPQACRVLREDKDAELTTLFGCALTVL